MYLKNAVYQIKASATLPVSLKLLLTLTSPPPHEGSQLLKVHFITVSLKPSPQNQLAPVVAASVQPPLHPVLYKNSLFLGYRIQGDVGLLGDPGVVEFVGVPKGDKGTQVCAMVLLRRIKWTRI